MILFVTCLNDENRSSAFTLIELMVVVIIIGILAAVALPTYTATKEKTLDRQAVAALRLLRAAERQYFVTQENYYPTSGTVTNLSQINDDLKTAINSTDWNFQISGNGTFFSINALRSDGSRNWTLNATGENLTCLGSSCL